MNDVKPVPPDVVGNAVPDKLIANVPLVVIGEPAIDKNDGTEAATLVTVPNGFDAQDVSVPSVVRYFPLFPVWLGANALKAALAVVCPVPPLRIGKVPVTPVVRGKPVALVSVTDVGVPSKGVTNVGLVANTSDPVPVSSVTAASKLALDGVAKNVATPVPKPLTPVLIGKSVALVSVADCGVPRIGVTKVGDVLNTKLVDVVPVAPEAV